MSILNNSLLLGADAGAGGYQISRSLRFNSADSAYLSRTPASAGNRKTWTWAGWVKRSAIGQQYADIFNAVDTGAVQDTIGFNYDKFFYYAPAIGFIRTSTAVYRDCSAWYHFVFCLDTTNATAQNRFRLWVNGSEVTTWQDNLTITQNVDLNVNKNSLHLIGAASGYTQPFDGYLADIHFIDGQALTPSSFTEVSATTGQLIPKAYTGSYGTNGFRLDFSDNSAATATTLGKDRAGSNNWSPTNLSVTAGAGNDSLVDTPTSYGTDTGAGGEVRGNYCTWNPLRSLGSLLNGNLDTSNITTGFEGCTGTVYVSSGKWYWEVAPLAADTATMIGAATNDHPLNSNYSASTTSWTYFMANGQKYGNGANGAAYGAAFASGDIIGVALDMDAGSITFYKNGVSQGVAFNTGIQGKSLTPLMSSFNTTGAKGSANFGQRPFAYTAPSGFKALCDTNLPAPVVAKPNSVFDVKLYTGNGGTQNITGLAFNPDLVWIKSRTNPGSGIFHTLLDAVRGQASGYYRALFSNSTDSEDAPGGVLSPGTVHGGVTALNNDGFTLSAGSSDQFLNKNTTPYVAWTWDAGSSTVTNTSGSISSQVRANASAGFSIVTYTGGAANSTVGHGLGAAPHLIIAKSRFSAGYTTSSWDVYHRSLGKDKFLYLERTDAVGAYTNYWGSVEPTSTVFGVSELNFFNNRGNMVAYCFAPVAGYSAFGSYTGNGSADGPFVYTGFRPRWVMFKRSDGASDWIIYDTSRDAYNVMGKPLYPSLANAEADSPPRVDYLSNGFKLRVAGASEPNWSGSTVIYAAFAENPFQYARAR